MYGSRHTGGAGWSTSVIAYEDPSAISNAITIGTNAYVAYAVRNRNNEYLNQLKLAVYSSATSTWTVYDGPIYHYGNTLGLAEFGGVLCIVSFSHSYRAVQVTQILSGNTWATETVRTTNGINVDVSIANIGGALNVVYNDVDTNGDNIVVHAARDLIGNWSSSTVYNSSPASTLYKPKIISAGPGVGLTVLRKSGSSYAVDAMRYNGWWTLDTDIDTVDTNLTNPSTGYYNDEFATVHASSTAITYASYRSSWVVSDV